MTTPTVIDRFAGQYRFLSNFFPCYVELDGVTYPSVEHAYQAAKTDSVETRAWIQAAPTPGQAKYRGGLRRRVKLRENWDSIRLDVMLELLRQKFAEKQMRSWLLATGDARLIEGNTWGDQFWGVVHVVGDNGNAYTAGENHLGKLLMQVRTELRQKFEKTR